ncbi:hypothetical protein CDL12_15340 [Handroanthus impetiginosus]|uniref:RING-type E3 ubiquitin transferase n=1 Tax=Handroanthus impetiginosus TaxID=429701 RepID=A0A2G9H3G5_9LAMI|nr:hypothetical protein CDL12_15340 [Handroanthus impetiginosus]
MDPQSAEPGKSYALSGKIMLTAIVVLFSVIVALVAVHLYLRWYFFRLHRRQQQRRRRRRAHVVFYADNNHYRPAVDRGLAPEVLKSLPVSLFSSKAAEASGEELPLLECAVCLSEFQENDVVRLLPKCNHSFHIGCIDMWFFSHSTCPLCRSAVEPVVNAAGPTPASAAEGDEEVCGSDPGSSSGSGLCAMCQHEEENGSSWGGQRKVNGGAISVRIEVSPPRLAPLENELTQSSPGTRFASLKRLLSMGKKSPIGSCASPPCGAGTSRVATELDLEVGVSEPVRVD